MRFARVAILLMGMAQSFSSWATPMVISSVAESGGLYLYDFSLSAGPADSIFNLYLDLEINPTDVVTIASPLGWGSFSDPFGASGFLVFGDNGRGGTFIDFVADFGAELFGPATLAGFSLTSAVQAPTPILFSVNFDPDLAEVQGLATVSLPGVLALYGAGLFSLFFSRSSRV